ncbi:helix-turn-helix transcriptional regulator [Mycobacterium sp. CnD-18-1]|uniref:helix-turn-helix domain-containing protein n=1 Tax=Mycobacterium sp. CnD-18-1 TaxID=2917744 RepID=UPI001EF39989|nr:helix-turn-helix transcriptional regulator [Mycobacterium sp. CnD-18-1]MCG7607186.1 helix-turn-helix domain-containing protein [Mycobacterium sp. CnD-18-1]
MDTKQRWSNFVAGALREAGDPTNKEVAARIGAKSQSVIKYWLDGKTLPSFELAKGFARAYYDGDLESVLRAAGMLTEGETLGVALTPASVDLGALTGDELIELGVKKKMGETAIPKGVGVVTPLRPKSSKQNRTANARQAPPL